MSYNPYSAINAIYNYKKEWDDADKSGDTAKKNKAAENAKAFYDQLRNNGKKDIADQLSAVDVSGAKYILDQYSTKNSGVDNLAYSNTMQSGVDKNNTLAGYIDSDRKDVQGKYNDIYNYANKDITKTDEYQSTYNNMMGKYDMSALQGRNNAVASGGASNGGNIDSYAAANALRQQTSILAQGQQIAHQAGLDAYNARVSNVSNILNNLGVYNSGTYDAMNQAIANDAGLAQQYFDNSETAKNNEVARLSEQASVTGYTPNEWVIKNDDIYKMFLNEDGTFKKEQEGVDIQALINQAKASGDTETAKKLAVVRTRKILSNYGEFGKYSNMGDISSMKPQQTEVGRQFDKQNETALKTLGAETDLAKYEIDTNKSIATGNNTTDLAIANLKNKTPDYDLADIERMLKNTKTPSQELIDVYNAISGDATTYTVDNPPPITGKNVDDETPNTIDLDADNASDETSKEYKDIYSKWNDSGIEFKNLSLSSFTTKDDNGKVTPIPSKIKSSDVDKNGKKAINSVLSALANGQLRGNGSVNSYELANFLIMQSDNNNTNKDQLGKVFAYFGLDKRMLDRVEDAGFWFWESGKGTKYK